ncbi:MAG TPA: serine/threonine-protein kinase [Acidobacteriota bacterium]|nr:serine/threonine-protein kinase [Acidobacteriota bacterium]
MATKKKLDSNSKYSAFSYAGAAFFSTFLGMFTLFLFVKTKDHVLLGVGFLMVLLCLAVPFGVDFIKAVALKDKENDQKQGKDWKKAMERIENLEMLMCRLDTEINAQLEQTLSAGKFTTVSTTSGNSQIPTLFLNLSSALQDRFQVLRELGRGGMGIVFQAHDKQLNEQVAIKVLSPLMSKNTEALERLKREVSAARRVTHQNIIRIHDISESNGLHFVSMEYFAGTTLKEIIKRDGACSLIKGAQLALQICAGVESAHKQGVIHRDLKSQNIIVNDTGELKIIDFGLASSAHMEGMTATGLILGTPEYMAPEQVAGKRADERADIYSFGIILYEMFTGTLPFSADTAIAVGFKQLREAPQPPRTLKSQLPVALEAIILKALQKDPASRYASMSEMQSELEAVFQKSVQPDYESVAEARPVVKELN